VVLISLPHFLVLVCLEANSYRWCRSLVGLSFIILNTWTALSASLSLALPVGGPSVVLWGLVVSGICKRVLGREYLRVCGTISHVSIKLALLLRLVLLICSVPR